MITAILISLLYLIWHNAIITWLTGLDWYSIGRYFAGILAAMAWFVVLMFVLMACLCWLMARARKVFPEMNIEEKRRMIK